MLTKWLKKYFVPHEGNEFKPHFLRHESMMLFFFVVLVFEIGFLVQTFVVFDKTKFLATVLPGVLTTLTNEQRAQNDALPLVENVLLDRAAQAKAEDMASLGYFAHTSPEGKTPWHWFAQVGYKYIYAGENLAVNFFESDDVAEAWMNSPTHRANIVKKDYTEIGIGVAKGTYEGRSTVFVAQLFGTPQAVVAVTEIVPQAPVKEVPKITPTKTPVVPSTTPTVIPTVVATNPTPTTVEVLGEEVVSPNVSTNNISKQSPVRAFIQKALSSPRQSLTYVYEVMALIIILALVILFIRSERRHPPMVARGLAMIVIIVVLSFVNLKVLSFKTEVPTDNHNLSANVVQVFP